MVQILLYIICLPYYHRCSILTNSHIKVFTARDFLFYNLKKKLPATFCSWNDDGDFTTTDVFNCDCDVFDNYHGS